MSVRRRSADRGYEDDFVAYYQARAGILRRTAYLLAGDWQLAEDLTQTTFIKLYQRWHRIERHDVLDQYARRVLLRTFLDERRRPWRREHASGLAASAMAPGTSHEQDGSAAHGVEDRLVLRTALARIPKRRRAVLVLRFWTDLSVEQVADILGCSPGTVRSQTSRGLADLRDALGGELADLGQPLLGGGRS
jgi:RNA polymerase sigma-70 factor (sigma-E family)